MSASVKPMDFRYLGNSGFKISEITFGNWLTHGSQVENDVAAQCVRAALDAGISTFDTADAYANTAAETVPGEALKGEFVVVVAPPAEDVGEPSDEMIAQQLEKALKLESFRDAVRSVAEVLNVSRARVYELGLKLKRD